MLPDFLAIGHVTKDVTPDGNRLGGTVAFAALTASRLGLSPAVVTSAAPDLDVRSSIPGVPIHVVPSDENTTFHNTYRLDQRVQRLERLAAPIEPADIPTWWLSARLVLLGPLVGEVSYQLAQAFPNALVLASIQGWLRRWDRKGLVGSVSWNGTEVLPHVDAAVCSNADIGNSHLLDLWKTITPVLIVTMGSEGARLHFEGDWHRIEPFPTQEMDPTGAGDVFGAAYLIRYGETLSPLESARFASCAASFCVEAKGMEGVPTRAQVERRLAGRNH